MLMKSFLKGNNKMFRKPMSGSEIAKELGVTRQAISNVLKRSLNKVFKEVKKRHIKECGVIPNNFEIISEMVTMFNVEGKDIKKFYRMFSMDIKRKIEKDAENIYRRT